MLLVDKLGGMVTSSSMVPPLPDLKSMYESVPQIVLEELLKIGHRPSEIEIRSDLLIMLLDDTLEHAGCQVAEAEVIGIFFSNFITLNIPIC